MKNNFIVLLCILFLQQSYTYGQQSISIYDYGSPITDYEDNFKNLIKNWNKKNVTNADEFEILECSFVETISTWERYNHYRNYFSSDQVVLCSTSGSSVSDHKGNKKYEFTIKPGYAYTEYYDTRGLPDNMKAILTDEFREKAKEILSQEFNIDTMNIKYYQFSDYKTDTISRRNLHFNEYGITHENTSLTTASTDSLSKKYSDVFVTGEKTIYDFEIKVAQELILKNLISERLLTQTFFNNTVKTGDKVFVIKFKHEHQLYSSYLICSSETKKVVWDFLFSRIRMDHLAGN